MLLDTPLELNHLGTPSTPTTAKSKIYPKSDGKWYSLDPSAVELKFIQSDDLTTALATKENSIAAGTTAQYYRGDKTWQTLNPTAVGLSAVPNLSGDKMATTLTGTGLTAGWVRIATQANGAGNARFMVWDTTGSTHNVLEFEVAIAYNNVGGGPEPQINIMQSTRYGTFSLTGVRVARDPSAFNNTAVLEVQIQNVTSINVSMYTNMGGGPWTQVTPANVTLGGTYTSYTTVFTDGSTGIRTSGKVIAAGGLSGALSPSDISGGGSSGQYLRGDKTWQTLNLAAVGVPGVDYVGGVNRLTASYTMGGQVLSGTITAGVETIDGPYKSNGTTGDNVSAIKLDAGTVGAGWRIFEIDTPGYWTYSFWYRRRSTQATDINFTIDMCDMGNKTFTATTTWQRGFITVDVSSVFNGTYRFLDVSLGAVGGVNLFEPMLERSQIASAYQPTDTELRDASIIQTGVLSTARLGTGTANGAYYLRGDGTWAVMNEVAVGLSNVVNLRQVDLQNNQTVGGQKSFTTIPQINQAVGTFYNLSYLDSTSYKMPLYHDRVRFSSPTYEVSADGTTWVAGTGGRICLSNRSDGTTDIADTARYVRWTWNDASMAYSAIAILLLKFGYVNPAPTLTVVYETSPDGTTWTNRATGTVTNPSAQVYEMRVNDPVDHIYHRVRIQAVGGATSGSVVRINGLELQTARWGDQGSGPEREWPFGWDFDRKVAAYNQWYPATNNAIQLGGTSNRWSTIYGVNLDVTGTVTGVTKTHVGLSNVLNVVQEPAITGGTTSQFWRGDKTWQSLAFTTLSGTIQDSQLRGSLKQYGIDNTVGDANSATDAGNYYFQGTSNGPPTGSDGYLNVSTYNLSYSSQLYTSVQNDQMWYRRKVAGAYQSWVRIVDKTYGDTLYEPKYSAGTTGQYYRGDKTWQTLNSAAVGLGSVPNVDMTNLSNATSGTVPVARLPGRIGIDFSGAVSVISSGTWDSVTTPGIYAIPAGIGGGPSATEFICEVRAWDVNWVTQRAWSIYPSGSGGTTQYVRQSNNLGVWSSWQPLNQGAFDARYALYAHNHSGVYEPVIAGGTTSQYYRGDKTWQTLDKTAVGLSAVPNVDMTNVSNATSGTLPAARHSSLAAISAAIASSANITASGWKIVNLADGTGVADAVNKGQLDASLASLPAMGQELASIEKTSNYTTTNTTAWVTLNTAKITGLTVTVTGTGRPVDVEFYTSNMYHSAATVSAPVYTGVYFIVNSATNNANSATSTILVFGTAAGPHAYMKKRLVLTSGTSYQFEVGVFSTTGGTTTVFASTSSPMLLAVTQR